jgi:hypothetical protein
MKLKLTIIALLLAFISEAQLPEQDCVNAIPICSPQPITYTNIINGGGNLPSEVDYGNNCLQYEKNSVWFKVYVQQNGELSFTLIPDVVFPAAIDLDWAVFDLTNATCQDISSYTDTLEVSCNFNSEVGINSTTGPNGFSGGQFEPVIPVLAGHVYYIIVSRYTGDSAPFTINFDGSTCFGTPQPFSFNTTELPSLCQPNQLNVYLNQSVQCVSLAPSDFALYDNNNQPIPIMGMNTPECNNLLDYSSSFMLMLDQDLVSGQQYKLVKTGSVVVPCGVTDQSYSEVSFTPQPFNFDIISFDIDLDTCYHSCTVDAIFVDTLFKTTYSWNVPSGTSISPYYYYVSGHEDGNYSFSISTSTGCTASHTEYVDVFDYDQIEAIDIEFVGDTAYAEPNSFQSYFWQLRLTNGTIQTTHTTYAPINYIELSDFTIEYPCIVWVWGHDEYDCVKYYYIGYPVYLWAGVDENKIFSSVQTNENTVSVNSINIVTGKASLYDLSGRMLQSQSVINSKNFQIDISSFAAGLYILTFTNNNGKSYSTKIVKTSY